MARNVKAMNNKMISTTLALIAALAMAIPGRAQSSASAGSASSKAGKSASASTGTQKKAQSDESIKQAQAAIKNAEKTLDGFGINIAELSGQIGNLRSLSELGNLAEIGQLNDFRLENFSIDLSGLTNLGALAQIQEGMSGSVSSGVGGGIARGISGGIPAGVYAFGEAGEQEDREAELYNEGTSAMDDGKWDRALDKFSQVAEMHGKKADAAVYYKARALYKLGRRDEALSTLTGLERDYPKSRWLNDAKALEIEIKQKSGQQVSPEAQSDCELKLYALNGLQQADPEKAVPLLEKMLHGSDCPKLSSQAFFILAQSGSQQARDVIIKLAKGDSTNPDMQRKAIQALGMYGGSYGREALSQVFTSTGDVDTKKAVLRALMMSGDRERILAAAKGEKLPEVRSEAIRQLGMMGAKDAIWQLYQTETSVEVKTQILQAMWMAGDRQHVEQLALKETDHTLRLKAINDLGLMGRDSDSALVNIYNSDPDPEIRKKVLNSIFLAGDRERMGDLAKNEKNPDLRMSAINYLGLMGKESDPILVSLYNSDSDLEVRKKVLNALFLAGDRERMGDLAKNEKNRDLRLSAINYLGLMGKQSDDILIGIYKSDADPEVRKKVINALFLAGDAKGLVEIARSETNPEMKKAIVSQLSLMHSKEATDYLMELLNK
ncbi:MAG TPA: HEAT repeat domain-containing protein [Candidatus Acidoferrum sp.]|nr:HEAT repeat domain-containing protein [Candidatus Acidoferrum sp.]